MADAILPDIHCNVNRPILTKSVVQSRLDNEIFSKFRLSIVVISETKNELKFIPKDEWKKRFSGVDSRKSGKG